MTLPEKALAAAKEAGQPADVFYAFNLLESTGTHTGSIINKNCLCECVAKPLFLGYCQCCQMANFLFLTYFKWVIREKRKTKKMDFGRLVKKISQNLPKFSPILIHEFQLT